MSKRLAAGLVLGLASLPAASQAAVYDCTAQSTGGPNGWIDGRTIITFDEKAGSVSVESEVTQHELGKPAKGKISSNTGAKYTFTWVVPARDSSGQQAKMLYRAVVTKANGALNLSATPQGYSDTFRAPGKCVLK